MVKKWMCEIIMRISGIKPHVVLPQVQLYPILCPILVTPTTSQLHHWSTGGATTFVASPILKRVAEALLETRQQASYML